MEYIHLIKTLLKNQASHFNHLLSPARHGYSLVTVLTPAVNERKWLESNKDKKLNHRVYYPSSYLFEMSQQISSPLDLITLAPLLLCTLEFIVATRNLVFGSRLLSF